MARYGLGCGRQPLLPCCLGRPVFPDKPSLRASGGPLAWAGAQRLGTSRGPRVLSDGTQAYFESRLMPDSNGWAAGLGAPNLPTRACCTWPTQLHSSRRRQWLLGGCAVACTVLEQLATVTRPSTAVIVASTVPLSPARPGLVRLRCARRLVPLAGLQTWAPSRFPAKRQLLPDLWSPGLCAPATSCPRA